MSMPKGHRSQYLVNEPPIPLYPSLAVALESSDRALILQQLNYWLTRSDHLIDGRYWVYNTLKAWNEQFPWLSLRTLQRHLDSLEEQGLILTGNYNKVKTDRTKWYSIDDAAIGRLLAQDTEPENASGQNGQMGTRQNGVMHSASLARSVPETNEQKNNQESDDHFLARMKTKYRLTDRQLGDLLLRYRQPDGTIRQAAMWGDLASKKAAR